MVVNGARTGNFLSGFAEIGRSCPNGVTRLGYAEEERRAHALLTRFLAGLPVVVETDFAGNTYFYNPQACADGPAVLVGSHLDTPPDGGRFDGALGVVAALELMHCFHQTGALKRLPVKGVAFACEESSRFGTSSIGSRLATGQFSAEPIYDTAGVELSTAMEALGFRREPRHDGRLLDVRNVAGCFEMHIEQGPVLDDEKIPLGIVSGIAAPLRLKIEVAGQSLHTGTTPMNRRSDALVTASCIVCEVEAAAAAENSPNCVATVGTLQNFPNSMNVIPGRVELAVDIRDIDAARRHRVAARIRETATAVARQRGCSLSFATLQESAPQPLTGAAVDVLTRRAESRGCPYRMMASGAGHDAMYLARIGVPTAMLFIPSRNGISHNPAEHSEADHIISGIEVLYGAVTEYCARELRCG
jgi:hydantoinase/carbamoylase family amidase